MNYLEEKLHDKLIEKQKEVFELQDEKKELQTRIDKAIEYIEDGRLYDINNNCINEILLMILKGE